MCAPGARRWGQLYPNNDSKWGNGSLSEYLGIYPRRGIGAEQLKQYMSTTFHLLAAYGLHRSSHVIFKKFLFIIMQLSPHKT